MNFEEYKNYLLLFVKKDYKVTNWDEEYIDEILEDWLKGGERWKGLADFINDFNRIRVYDTWISEEDLDHLEDKYKIRDTFICKVLGVK